MWRIAERKYLDFDAVCDISWNVTVLPRLEQDNKDVILGLRQAFGRNETVRDARNFTSIYRLMGNLEKRGLVATILHATRAVWYHVREWKDGKPIIDLCEGPALLQYVKAKSFLEFRCKNVIWGITAGPSPSP
jgi:hypothetical protein